MPISSELPVRLEPRGGTLPPSKAAWSEVFALSARSAPSDRSCVAEGSHSRGSRPDVVSVVKMGDDVVVVFSSDAFARDESLAGHLVSFGGALTTRSLFSIEKSLVSSSGRILYRLFDSNTGGGRVEVVKACPETWGRGIFECAIDKVSVHDIKVSDWPTEEESSPVCKSLVVAAESCAQRPTLLPPRF